MVNSYEEDGSDCCLAISTSLLSCGEMPLELTTKSTHSGKPVFSDNLHEGSKIGLCVYKSGSFNSLSVNSDSPEHKAENILSKKNTDNWCNSTEIQLRQPVNVYAYYPFNSDCFVPGNAKDPSISSDDIAPMIVVKPGETNYLYGKAEKGGNGIMDVITPKNNKAQIRFNYAMSFVVFRLKSKSDYFIHNIQSVSLNNITAQALLSLENGVVKTDDKFSKRIALSLTRSDDFLNSVLDKENHELFFQSFVIPQEVDNTVVCSIRINESNSYIKLGDTGFNEWEGGMAYIYTLSVNQDKTLELESVDRYKL
ncbi:MAG: fimbrillin family protein [Bacteroidales bacterium]